MYFSVITKNLNWEILIKIQLLLKDEMGLRMKNLNIVMEDSMKNLTFKGGEFLKNQQNIGGNCL